MKLAARDAAKLFARPAEGWPGLMIYGADPMRVAAMRAEAVAALTGPEAEAEMRLARLSAEDLRRDAAGLSDALRAQGFFPGPRAVVLEGATDGLAPLLTAALKDWQPGDARLIVTAGQLKPASALRKLFEGHKTAHALPLYADPPGRAEVEAMLRAAGLSGAEPAAMTELMALAQQLEPGDLRQTVEKLALYRLNDPGPATAEDIAAVAPASVEGAVDDALDLAAEAQAGAIGPMMRRLEAQGVTPVTLCIGAGRHFRLLHAVAADPAGANRHLAQVRNPRARQRIERQARAWGPRRLEQALSLLIEADLTLRSSSRAPAMAVMERTLLRLATLARAR